MNMRIYKKKLVYGGLILASLGIGFVACKKEKVSNQNQLPDENHKESKLVSEIEFDGEIIYFDYRLNNKKELNPQYNLESDTLTNVVEGVIDKVKGGRNKRIIIHSFSDRKEYLEFASDYPDLENAEKFENLIHEYIKNNPEVIKECEENENCDDYLKYQEEVYNKIFGKSFSAKAPTAIHEGHYCHKGAWVMVSTVVPFMAPGWNNRVSSVFNLNIISFMNFYDRTFFRDRMATFIGFHGWQCIPFTGGLSFLDNRISSVIH